MHVVDKYCSMFFTRLPLVFYLQWLLLKQMTFVHTCNEKNKKNVFNNWNEGQLKFKKWYWSENNLIHKHLSEKKSIYGI